MTTSLTAFRLAREFEVRQPHAAHGDLVGADRGVGLEAKNPAGGDVVVLIHAIATDTQAGDEPTCTLKDARAGLANDGILETDSTGLASAGAFGAEVTDDFTDRLPVRAGI